MNSHNIARMLWVILAVDRQVGEWYWYRYIASNKASR